MTVAQWISAIIIGALPFLIGFNMHLARIQAQKLPEHQIRNLEIFASMAVRATEQMHGANSGKHAIAEAAIFDAFRAYNLPTPPNPIIKMAIEAANFSLSKKAD